MKTVAEEIYGDGTPDGCATLTVSGDNLSGYLLELHMPGGVESLSLEFLEDCAAAIRSHIAGTS